jgi:predicted transcriptional regulator
MTDTKRLTSLTANIVSAYVASNTLSPGDLLTLINAVHKALAKVGEPEVPAVVDDTAKATAAQIRESITPDALISFIDGKRFKTLRGHLTTHGLTIAAYKLRYGLPADYPTTAPSYSARRSAMAKEMGLGRRGRTVAAPVETAAVEAVAEVEVAAPVKRGRPKKAS